MRSWNTSHIYFFKIFRGKHLYQSVAKAAVQIQPGNFDLVPKGDPRNLNVSGCLRHIPVIEPAKEAAGSRHAWWLKFGRIDRREQAISRALAGICQISDTLRAQGQTAPRISFFTWWNSGNRVIILPILHVVKKDQFLYSKWR